MQELDNACILGMQPIDIIAISSSPLEFIEGCKLLNYDEIALSNHRAYEVGNNIEEYF